MPIPHPILVVDADPTTLAATTFALETAGYAVTGAADADDALRRARLNPPGLALIETGSATREIFSLLRRDPALGDAPILVIAPSSPNAPEGPPGTEADDYMIRPFSERELVARVRLHLRQRELTEQLRASKQQFASAFECAAINETDRETAGRALVESEQRFRTLLQGIASVAVQSYGPDGVTRYWNQASEKFYGYTAEEALGRNLLDLIIPAEMKTAVTEAMRTMAATGQPIPSAELTLRRKDGSPVTVFSSHAIVRIPGREPEMFCIDIDLTERKHAEQEISRTNRALKLLGSCNDALIRAEDESGLLDRICRIAVDLGGYQMAWVGYAEENKTRSIRPAAHAGREEGYLSEIRASWNADDPWGGGPSGQVIRKGRPVVCEDIANDPCFAPWRALADARGYRAGIWLPLRDTQRTFGFLGLYGPRPNRPSEEEVELLQEMADNLAFGILNLRARAEQRRTHEAVLTMARGIYSSTGAEFFEKLTHSIVKALGAQGGFIARWASPDKMTMRTLSAVVAGRTAPNFEYPLADSPAEHLDKAEACIVPRDARSLYPHFAPLSDQGIEAYVGSRLVDAEGRTLGVMFVTFLAPIQQPAFIASTLKIFASRASAELQRQEVDAKTREQAALIDEARDAFVVLGCEQTIQFWSKGAERLYGWTTPEAAGRRFLDLLLVDRAAFDEAIRIVRETGAWTGTVEKTARGGAKLLVEGRWTLLRDAQGRADSILIIDTDVTEQKKLEQQFLRAQRMESIGTLAGGIAHDLNNLLAPISMGVELLRQFDPSPRSLPVIDTMARSAKRGADLVRQVLSFARGIEGSRIALQIAPLILETRSITENTFPKNIVIETRFTADLWPVLADPTQINQVLLNLCVNARDSMPEGGRLELSARNVEIDAQYAAMNRGVTPGRYVVVQVTDAGCGMPKEIVDRIFEPFFTTKELGKGTGLGLSTVLGIVRSHGGFVDVYSEVGQGSTFKVYLPAHREVNPGAPSHPAGDPLPRGRGELVLLVDDEAPILGITKQTLEAFGYRVLTAEDGAQAIGFYALRRAEIAVVLTDMMMPVMDGPALITALLHINPSARIIAASGLNAQANVARVTSLGVKHFLAKPYSAEAMLTLLKKVLG